MKILTKQLVPWAVPTVAQEQSSNGRSLQKTFVTSYQDEAESSNEMLVGTQEARSRERQPRSELNDERSEDAQRLSSRKKRLNARWTDIDVEPGFDVLDKANRPHPNRCLRDQPEDFLQLYASEATKSCNQKHPRKLKWLFMLTPARENHQRPGQSGSQLSNSETTVLCSDEKRHNSQHNCKTYPEIRKILERRQQRAADAPRESVEIRLTAEGSINSATGSEAMGGLSRRHHKHQVTPAMPTSVQISRTVMAILALSEWQTR